MAAKDPLQESVHWNISTVFPFSYPYSNIGFKHNTNWFQPTPDQFQSSFLHYIHQITQAPLFKRECQLIPGPLPHFAYFTDGKNGKIAKDIFAPIQTILKSQTKKKNQSKADENETESDEDQTKADQTQTETDQNHRKSDQNQNPKENDGNFQNYKKFVKRTPLAQNDFFRAFNLTVFGSDILPRDLRPQRRIVGLVEGLVREKCEFGGDSDSEIDQDDTPEEIELKRKVKERKEKLAKELLQEKDLPSQTHDSLTHDDFFKYHYRLVLQSQYWFVLFSLGHLFVEDSSKWFQFRNAAGVITKQNEPKAKPMNWKKKYRAWKDKEKSEQEFGTSAQSRKQRNNSQYYNYYKEAEPIAHCNGDTTEEEEYEVEIWEETTDLGDSVNADDASNNNEANNAKDNSEPAAESRRAARRRIRWENRNAALGAAAAGEPPPTPIPAPAKTAPAPPRPVVSPTTTTAPVTPSPGPGSRSLVSIMKGFFDTLTTKNNHQPVDNLHKVVKTGKKFKKLVGKKIEIRKKKGMRWFPVESTPSNKTVPWNGLPMSQVFGYYFVSMLLWMALYETIGFDPNLITIDPSTSPCNFNSADLNQNGTTTASERRSTEADVNKNDGGDVPDAVKVGTYRSANIDDSDKKQEIVVENIDSGKNNSGVMFENVSEGGKDYDIQQPIASTELPDTIVSNQFDHGQSLQSAQNDELENVISIIDKDDDDEEDNHNFTDDTISKEPPFTLAPSDPQYHLKTFDTSSQFFLAFRKNLLFFSKLYLPMTALPEYIMKDINLTGDVSDCSIDCANNESANVADTTYNDRNNNKNGNNKDDKKLVEQHSQSQKQQLLLPKKSFSFQKIILPTPKSLPQSIINSVFGYTIQLPPLYPPVIKSANPLVSLLPQVNVNLMNTRTAVSTNITTFSNISDPNLQHLFPPTDTNLSTGSLNYKERQARENELRFERESRLHHRTKLWSFESLMLEYFLWFPSIYHLIMVHQYESLTGSKFPVDIMADSYDPFNTAYLHHRQAQSRVQSDIDSALAKDSLLADRWSTSAQKGLNEIRIQSEINSLLRISEQAFEQAQDQSKSLDNCPDRTVELEDYDNIPYIEYNTIQVQGRGQSLGERYKYYKRIIPPQWPYRGLDYGLFHESLIHALTIKPNHIRPTFTPTDLRNMTLIEFAEKFHAKMVQSMDYWEFFIVQSGNHHIFAAGMTGIDGSEVQYEIQSFPDVFSALETAPRSATNGHNKNKCFFGAQVINDEGLMVYKPKRVSDFDKVNVGGWKPKKIKDFSKVNFHYFDHDGVLSHKADLVLLEKHYTDSLKKVEKLEAIQYSRPKKWSLEVEKMLFAAKIECQKHFDNVGKRKYKDGKASSNADNSKIDDDNDENDHNQNSAQNVENPFDRPILYHQTMNTTSWPSHYSDLFLQSSIDDYLHLIQGYNSTTTVSNNNDQNEEPTSIQLIYPSQQWSDTDTQPFRSVRQYYSDGWFWTWCVDFFETTTQIEVLIKALLRRTSAPVLRLLLTNIDNKQEFFGKVGYMVRCVGGGLGTKDYGLGEEYWKDDSDDNCWEDWEGDAGSDDANQIKKMKHQWRKGQIVSDTTTQSSSDLPVKSQSQIQNEKKLKEEKWKENEKQPKQLRSRLGLLDICQIAQTHLYAQDVVDMIKSYIIEGQQ